MPSLSVIVPIIYFSLPMAVLMTAVLRFRRTRDANPLRDTLIIFVVGAVGGLAVASFYMRRAILPPTEVAIACYWGVAVACALRVFNAVLKWGIARLTPSGANGRPCCPAADVAGSVLRSILLFSLAVPYVGAMVLIWRPHVVSVGTPRSVLGQDYEDISFVASDGVHIRGWWIPAGKPQDGNVASAPSERTIIVCHGFESDKAADLRLVRDLAPNNFNILAFDFRGHGQSDGELCTFGDLERRDVLGAVKWVRSQHPEESRKIFGLGVGLGSAALIAAAADPNDGQFIDAVAVFAPYDRVTHLVQNLADTNYVPTVGWVATHVSLPIAGVQLGTPLSHFAPEDYVDKIAPRPLLVIAAEEDQRIEVSLSQQLFEQASQPKYAYWVKKGSRESMLFKNKNASKAVRFFFETARSVL